MFNANMPSLSYIAAVTGNDYDIYPRDGEHCRAGVHLSSGL